jgi:hypothetical protein
MAHVRSRFWRIELDITLRVYIWLRWSLQPKLLSKWGVDNYKMLQIYEVQIVPVQIANNIYNYENTK